MPAKKQLQKLKPGQERFVEEYVVSLNATAAYLKAYPESTYGTARCEGCKLLAKPSIQAAVKAERRAMSKRCKVSADRVIREYARLAFSDIDDVVDLRDPNNPKLWPRDSIPPDSRRAIREISQTTHGIRVKLADKRGALDNLMRHLGLYNDLPPLEVLLAGLSPEVAAAVRTALASAVLAGRDPSSDQPTASIEPSDPGPPAQRSDGAVPGDGVDARSMAGRVSDEPGEAGEPPLFPAGG